MSIEGFPFLTQLAAKDFKKVDISASNVPAGPVTITSVHATINGMHISSLSSNASAKVDHVTATAFISFGALAAAGGLGDGSGITVSQDGPNKLKITAGVGGVFSDTEEAKIVQTGPQTHQHPGAQQRRRGRVAAQLASVPSRSPCPRACPASLRITSARRQLPGPHPLGGRLQRHVQQVTPRRGLTGRPRAPAARGPAVARCGYKR